MRTILIAAAMMVTGCVNGVADGTERFPPEGTQYPTVYQVSNACFEGSLPPDASPFGNDGGPGETCLQACQALAGPDAAAQCIR